MDANRVEVNGKLKEQSWSVKLTHELSKQDKLEATVKSSDVQKPVLSYSRTQDGVTLTLSAPVSSDISADAKLSVVRTFDL